MNKPACVAISDIHWGLSTLAEAKEATSRALRIAEDLKVPLCILGDLNDTKDILRGKVLNTLIEILQTAKVKVYILIGNHDKLHEKSKEHGLNCLKPYATVIDSTCSVDFMEAASWIPYQSSNEEFLQQIRTIEPGSTIFMHQGVQGAHMGDYRIDDSSVDLAALAPFNCISGHYHRHQTVGTLTYIGSPYTISFTEATDGPKGCLVVNHDGTWRRELFTGVRKHVVVERDLRELLDLDAALVQTNPNDLIWLKLRGTHQQLDVVDKKYLGLCLFGRIDYKLDLIYDEVVRKDETVDAADDADVMDNVIDASTFSHKDELKTLWRSII